MGDSTFLVLWDPRHRPEVITLAGFLATTPIAREVYALDLRCSSPGAAPASCTEASASSLCPELDTR